MADAIALALAVALAGAVCALAWTIGLLRDERSMRRAAEKTAAGALASMASTEVDR